MVPDLFVRPVAIISCSSQTLFPAGVPLSSTSPANVDILATALQYVNVWYPREMATSVNSLSRCHVYIKLYWFLAGSLLVLLCYTQCFAMGALMQLWGVVGSNVSSHGTRCIRIYSISADLFTESRVNAFQEYVVNCQQAGELWGFLSICLLEAIFTEWKLYGW